MRRSTPAWASVGYCHGITVGDIDNDGDPDVFLSNYGGDVLYLNNGNGSFSEIGRAAGITAASEHGPAVPPSSTTMATATLICT